MCAHYLPPSYKIDRYVIQIELKASWNEILFLTGIEVQKSNLFEAGANNSLSS